MRWRTYQPPLGLPWSFPSASVGWSGGALQNIKFQAPNLRVIVVWYHSVTRCQVSGVGSGVGCKVSEVTDLKPEH